MQSRSKPFALGFGTAVLLLMVASMYVSVRRQSLRVLTIRAQQAVIDVAWEAMYIQDPEERTRLLDAQNRAWIETIRMGRVLMEPIQAGGED